MSRALVRTAYGAVALAALAAVFSVYTHPDFIMTLATQVWACF